MFFGRRTKREPGVWFDPYEGSGLFPREGTPEYHTRLVSGDLAAAYYDPRGEKVEVLVAPNLGRFKDLSTPFFGYVRNLLRERGLRGELGRAKAQQIETRAREDYPYYEQKAQFKALGRIQLNQPPSRSGDVLASSGGRPRPSDAGRRCEAALPRSDKLSTMPRPSSGRSG